jgi:ABC-type glycerol-3-phosphate transport system permease component
MSLAGSLPGLRRSAGTNPLPRSRGRAGWGRLAVIAVLIGAALATVAPFLWLVVSSLKTEADIFASPLALLKAPTLANYASLFKQFHFAIATLNSIAISLGVVVISVALGGLAAYGFSRYPFTGSRVLLSGLLITRMVTPAALVVPLYLIMNALGLLNTLISIILGIAVLNLPFVIWVLRPFFDALPREIEEAGLVDGLSPFGVFLRIAVRLAAPGLVTVALLSFIAGWTDLLFPMSFTTTPEATPLTSGLLQMQTGYKIYWGSLMAGGVYLTLPTLVLSFALQKYLIRGMRLGY